jgi:hypothetical protein
MLIEIADLEIHPVDFREEFSPGVIDLGEEVGSGRRSAPRAGRIWSRSITASTRWCRTSG